MSDIRMPDGSPIPAGSVFKDWKFDPNGHVLQAGTIETPKQRNRDRIEDALKRIEERLSKIEAHLGIK